MVARDLYERTIPLFIMSFIGAWMIAEYFIGAFKPLIPYSDLTRTFSTIIGSISYGIGVSILTLAHGRRIYNRTKDPFYGYSILYMIFFGYMVIAALIGGVEGDIFLWGYDVIFTPAGQALYSTTAFYITTAAYRIFRFRNLDAAVLLTAGTLVLMSVLPIFTGFIPPIKDIGSWIMNVPGTAGYRAFTIGVAIGTIGLGLRIFLHKHPEVLR